MPKDALFNSVVIENPMVSFLLKGLVPFLFKVVFRVTVLVMPCRVKSPMTSAVFFPVTFMDLLLKVAVGNFSVLRKSALFR